MNKKIIVILGLALVSTTYAVDSHNNKSKFAPQEQTFDVNKKEKNSTGHFQTKKKQKNDMENKSYQEIEEMGEKNFNAKKAANLRMMPRADPMLNTRLTPCGALWCHTGPSTLGTIPGARVNKYHNDAPRPHDWTMGRCLNGPVPEWAQTHVHAYSVICESPICILLIPIMRTGEPITHAFR